MILAIFHDMTHDMKTQTGCCYYNLLSSCSYCMFFVAMCVSFSPNRFTCEGFLLLLKGCMLGPDDFEFVSGLVFLAA